jgi:aryl-alcohol dehydrogenase-like predicted oxidoreductase
MDYRYAGKTGLRISEIGFGTQTFGWTTDRKEAFEMLDHYVGLGGNYLDTADSYNDGKSEEILGEWLKARGRNDDLIVGTKVYFASKSDDSPNGNGLSRKHLIASVDRSLSRLGVDAIDLLQLHCYDSGTEPDEVMGTLDDLIRRGKILYYGLSNFLPSSIMRIVDIARFKALHQPASLQLEYSLLVRSSEWELLPLCAEEGLAALAWSPLAGGWLTGKYKKGSPSPANSRVGRGDRWDDQEEQRGGDRTWAILDILEKIGESRRVPISHVALNWMRRKPFVSSILIGARDMDQLRQNLECLKWDMTREEEESLDRVSDIPQPYPYGFVGRYGRKSWRSPLI